MMHVTGLQGLGSSSPIEHLFFNKIFILMCVHDIVKTTFYSKFYFHDIHGDEDEYKA